MLYVNNYTTDNIQSTYTCSTANCNGNGTQETNKTEVNSTLPYEYICVLEPEPEDILTSRAFQTCVYIMYGAIFLVALLGNGLVCFVVHSCPRMKTVTNYFIMNLAVGDIMMTIFCVPFSFVSMLILRYWPFGGFMCKMVHYSQAVSVLVSAYTLLAISIDRYFVITRPMKPRLSKMTAKLVMVAVWCGALATAAPILIVSQLQKPSLWHQVCNLDICSEKWANAEQSAQYTWALWVLQFVLPLGALICTYGRIAFVVWGVQPPGEAEIVRDSRIQLSKRKMVKMMITVVAVFTICWLPLNIFLMLWTAHEDDEEWSKWPGMHYVWFVTHWLAMSHCCYNPIIYCYMNVRYRSGFQQVLGRIIRLNNKETSRSCRRTSVCEGIPLSHMVGVNSSTRQRNLTRFRSSFQGMLGSVRERSNINCTCNSRRQTLPIISTHAPPRALSVRSHFE